MRGVPRIGACGVPGGEHAVLPTFRAIMSNRAGTCGCRGRLVRKARRDPLPAVTENCLLATTGR